MYLIYGFTDDIRIAQSFTTVIFRNFKNFTYNNY